MSRDGRAPADLPAACAHACLAAGAVGAAEIAVFLASAGSHEAPDLRFGVLVVLASFFAAGIVAAVHLLLAVPLYLLLRAATGPVGTATVAAAGFVIGAVPIPLWTPPYSIFAGGSFESILVYGIPGLAAGFAFGRRINRRVT